MRCIPRVTLVLSVDFRRSASIDEEVVGVEALKKHRIRQLARNEAGFSVC
jgi:hypothetical protein